MIEVSFQEEARVRASRGPASAGEGLEVRRVQESRRTSEGRVRASGAARARRRSPCGRSSR